MKYEKVYRSVLTVLGEAGPELHARCPFHPDTGKRSFSANVVTGRWKCFAQCGGGLYKGFVRKAKKIEALAAAIKAAEQGTDEGQVSGPQEKEIKYVPEAEVKAAIKRLGSGAGSKARRFLASERHISPAIQKAFQLGLADGDLRIWIPHLDGVGVRNVKRYDFLKSGPVSDKYKNYAVEMSGGDMAYDYAVKMLWPRGVVETNSQILLLEGEMDVMLAHSLGLKNAVTVTGGAGTWDDSFTRALAGKQVVICYDIDEAGLAGAAKVARLLSAKSDVRVASLPISEPKNADFTDYMKLVKWDVRDFIENVLAPALEDRNKAVPATLNSSSAADVYGKHLTIRAVVAGKDMTPYVVPAEVGISCLYSEDKAACFSCPLKAYKGRCDIPVPETSKPVIAAPESADKNVSAEVREWLGVPGQCPGCTVEVTKTRPLWEVSLTNDLDSAEQAGETEQYATRRGFSLVDLEPNVPYEFQALSTRDPKSQAALLELLAAKTSQTSLEAFSIQGKEALLKIWRV